MAPEPKKPKPKKKNLTKKVKVFFLTLLMAVTLHSQTRLLEQNFVHGHAAQEAEFAFSTGMGTY